IDDSATGSNDAASTRNGEPKSTQCQASTVCSKGWRRYAETQRNCSFHLTFEPNCNQIIVSSPGFGMMAAISRTRFRPSSIAAQYHVRRLFATKYTVC